MCIRDRLYTRLRTGNMKNVWTESDSYLSDAKSGDNTLKVDKLWYSFPIGDEFKVTVGPLIENYYMIETPTRYKPILKAFKLGGYGAVLGPAPVRALVCSGVRMLILVMQPSTLLSTTLQTVVMVQRAPLKSRCSVKTPMLIC